MDWLRHIDKYIQGCTYEIGNMFKLQNTRLPQTYCQKMNHFVSDQHVRSGRLSSLPVKPYWIRVSFIRTTWPLCELTPVNLCTCVWTNLTGLTSNPLSSHHYIPISGNNMIKHACTGNGRFLIDC